MCVCAHMCMCVCMSIHACVCACVYSIKSVHEYMSVLCMCVHVCKRVCVCPCTSLYYFTGNTFLGPRPLKKPPTFFFFYSCRVHIYCFFILCRCVTVVVEPQVVRPLLLHLSIRPQPCRSLSCTSNTLSWLALYPFHTVPGSITAKELAF